MLTREPVHYAALGFHRLFPRVSANQVTYTGIALVSLGTSIAEWQNVTGNKNKRLRLAALGLVLAGYGCDGLDGAVSRIIRDETGYKDPNGGHIDVTADRVEEFIQNSIRAYSADKLGRPWGSKMARINSVLSTPPSFVKSIDEGIGFDMPETGGVINIWGTRPGRAILNTVATFVPDIKGVAMEPILDTAAVAFNTYS